MIHKDVSNRIFEMAKADQRLRDELIKKGRLHDGYNPEMESLHRRNTASLQAIIEEIGYPTIELVGEESNKACWLIIQHSIGSPDFMRKCRELLQIAVNEKKANPIDLAYLTDRIAVLEGKAQLYGTQFDWDENKQMSPLPFDDVITVNQRRISLGLNSIEEQTNIMRKRVKDENQRPPEDFEVRKKEYNKWRKSVGWIE